MTWSFEILRHRRKRKPKIEHLPDLSHIEEKKKKKFTLYKKTQLSIALLKPPWKYFTR